MANLTSSEHPPISQLWKLRLRVGLLPAHSPPATWAWLEKIKLRAVISWSNVTDELDNSLLSSSCPSIRHPSLHGQPRLIYVGLENTN